VELAKTGIFSLAQLMELDPLIADREDVQIILEEKMEQTAAVVKSQKTKKKEETKVELPITPLEDEGADDE